MNRSVCLFACLPAYPACLPSNEGIGRGRKQANGRTPGAADRNSSRSSNNKGKVGGDGVSDGYVVCVLWAAGPGGCCDYAVVIRGHVWDSRLGEGEAQTAGRPADGLSHHTHNIPSGPR
jgi:hypothetical protein